MTRLSVDALNQNWLFKYKLYHIPFWCVYHYFWFTIAVANPVAAAKSMFFSAYSVKILAYVTFQALAVYFYLYYLMPRYMKKGSLTQYVIYLSLTVVCASSLINGGYYLSAFFAGCSVKKMFGVDPSDFASFYNTSFPSTVASMTLGMSIKLTKNWLQTQHRQQLLEKEKLETELKFLKYQFNPHFLFNSINDIYSLTYQRSDEAPAALLKLSDILRYMLREGRDDTMPLQSEVKYLEDVIELQRISTKGMACINFTIEGYVGMQPIATLLLIAFVENAFKHGVLTDAANPVKINLQATDEKLDFRVHNKKNRDQKDKTPGIGLNNVRRRLELMYPGRHTLAIDQQGEF